MAVIMSRTSSGESACGVRTRSAQKARAVPRGQPYGCPNDREAAAPRRCRAAARTSSALFSREAVDQPSEDVSAAGVSAWRNERHARRGSTAMLTSRSCAAGCAPMLRCAGRPRGGAAAPWRRHALGRAAASEISAHDARSRRGRVTRHAYMRQLAWLHGREAHSGFAVLLHGGAASQRACCVARRTRAVAHAQRREARTTSMRW